MKGTVKWFNEKKGFGFIIGDRNHKEYFAHFSEIKMEGFKLLIEGARVEFEIDKDEMGRSKAINVKEI